MGYAKIYCLQPKLRGSGLISQNGFFERRRRARPRPRHSVKTHKHVVLKQILIFIPCNISREMIKEIKMIRSKIMKFSVVLTAASMFLTDCGSNESRFRS